MKHKIIALLTCIVIWIGILPTSALASNTEDIIILYENDVHCTVEGYSKLSAMKKELLETYAHVGVVSCGDYVQGSSLGAISQGEYIVHLMNLVGYDAVTLGNHEFDYRLARLEELIAMMNTKPVCCNFEKNGDGHSYLEPYSIVTYGDVDIAYIGITTPTTISTSSPTQFKDENGDFLYTFHSADLYETVQASIDAAEAAGADYVIAISHIGSVEDETGNAADDIEALIENTDGFDVVLDAHSHSVIEGKKVTDKGGNDVLLSSTGTKFEHIGKLTISGGQFSTELIKTEDYQATDPIVDAYIAQINDEFATLGERKVADAEVDLITHDTNGNRLVRTGETNLGELLADAFRYAVDADVGYVNGGAIRTNIPNGEITFNDLISVLPFNNTIVLAEVSGQILLDVMETAVARWPAEDGAFPHLSGIRFSVNTSIPSSVVFNEQGEFVDVSGEYRVYGVEVYNKETEQYEPISLTKTYTLAALNYILLEYGNGMKMLENARIIQNDGMLEVEAVECYLTEKLGGTVGQEYANVHTSITFTDGRINPTAADDTALWIVLGIASGAVLLSGVVLLAVRRRRRSAAL